MSDNMVAVSYKRNQGGTRSLAMMREVEPIMVFAQKFLLGITAVHVPGVLNQQADLLSRQRLDQGEWSLNQQALSLITKRWGTPMIDLMATPGNCKMEIFFQGSSCPGISSECLSTDLEQSLGLCVSPIPNNIQSPEEDPHLHDGGYSDSSGMATEALVFTSKEVRSRDLLQQGPFFHPDPGQLRLVAWRLSSAV